VIANRKSQDAILKKLHISRLNTMQEEAQLAIPSVKNTMLLSPTGTGKTIAYLLPTIGLLDASCKNVQLLILVPSRELAIQIEQVIRNMGAGYKVNVVYGGRPFSKDKLDLKSAPAILVGTPGRIADHLRRKTFSVENIVTLVLDEFDKSLEIGFESEMSDIFNHLPNIDRRVLTSATKNIKIPSFVGLKDEVVIDHLNQEQSKLLIKKVISEDKNKLQALLNLVHHVGKKPGIIFCNFKNSIEYVSDYLTNNNIQHGCFHGGMEQIERERVLIKFRNGTYQLIIATDLASRGLDIPELQYIIHYQLPLRLEEFTHRNGRTARMNNTGTAFVLQWKNEYLAEFIKTPLIQKLSKSFQDLSSPWVTLFISGGRKDKISKGDIAGLFLKKGLLNSDDIGIIELKNDCAFIAVSKSKFTTILDNLNNTRLKKKKIRIFKI
jgi:superfamily II DNA/RNA helicase